MPARPTHTTLQSLIRTVTIAQRLAAVDDMMLDAIDKQPSASATCANLRLTVESLRGFPPVWVLQDTSSNTASSDGSQEEADQGSSSDTDSDNSESPIRPVTTCDTLQMERNDQVLSAQQRQQLRSRLADQLEELRVQQAAQSMDVLGL